MMGTAKKVSGSELFRESPVQEGNYSKGLQYVRRTAQRASSVG
jgi:hypothetical protein